jgi:hypothetical protein
MKYLTLFTSIALAFVAAWFSIAGLATIFSGAFVSVVIMASVLEFAKLVSAAWVHYEWDRINVLTRSYFVFAVVVLMFITSMGIFGYLSKAHIEQTISVGGNNDIQIQLLEKRIQSEERNVKSSETVLESLDQQVQTLIDYDRIRGPQGSIAVRESQREERNQLEESIQKSQKQIENYQQELIPLKQVQLELEAEIGPLKYIAELIYGDQASNYFDVAVRWIIIIIVMVFDPLAIMLLIVSTGAFKREIEKPSVPLIDENQIMVMR